LRALRSDLIDPTIALHHGRVIKRTGDGILIEFRSVVDAVRCAIEVQNGMVERNVGLPPERRIELRVGIHLGDVVEESDGDLMEHITPVLNMQSTDRQTDIRQAEEFAARALVADRNFYWAHLASATVLIAQQRHEEAIVELEQTLDLNPGFMNAYKLLCEANNYLGRPDRGLEYINKAIRLSPHDPNLPWSYGEKAWALLMLQQDDLAIEWLRRTVKRVQNPVSYALLASTLALTGRQAEATEVLKQYLSLKDTTSKTIAEFRPQHRAASDNPKWLAYSDRLVEGLRKAGMPEE
jgi:tetratricopeptide (TPR) repeat protein